MTRSSKKIEEGRLGLDLKKQKKQIILSKIDGGQGKLRIERFDGKNFMY